MTIRYKVIPTPDPPEPLFTQRTALEGVEYRFTFDWQERQGKWYMSLSDLDDNVIIAGIKVVVNWDLFRTVDPNIGPPGQLYVVNSDDTDPSFDTLHESSLLYLVASSIPQE